MAMCSCGWDNNDMRLHCRNCGEPLPCNPAVEEFSAEELGYQLVDKKNNVWESPTGERYAGFPGKPMTFQRIKKGP